MKLKLVSILVTIVTLVGMAFTFMVSCPNYTGAHQRVAEEQAHKWATGLGMEYKSVSCNRQDTDGEFIFDERREAC